MPWDSIEGCVVDGVATLKCIPAVFQNLLSTLLIFSGVVALFMILFAGVRLIMAGSDAKATEGARNILMYAIIGLVLILSSYFILSLVGYITGVPCILKFGLTNCSQ